MKPCVVERALVSVSDKKGIVDFCRGLAGQGVEILSTGGTATLLRKEEIAVTSVDSYIGFPEIMGGRVKTLHPRIHGGILAIRDNQEHRKHMEQHGIRPIDMVVVNLYPFKQTVAGDSVTLKDAVENIDIGGPTMIRSAAKNHDSVTVVVSPGDYETILRELRDNGNITLETRRRLATKAFGHTADYDAAIHAYLRKTFGGQEAEV